MASFGACSLEEMKEMVEQIMSEYNGMLVPVRTSVDLCRRTK